MALSFYYTLCLLSCLAGQTVSLLCYSCQNADSVEKCQEMEYCDSEQSCYTRTKTFGVHVTFYSMGCTDNQNCGSIPVYSALSVPSNTQTCYECCGSDQCNIHLCDHPKPKPCVDAEEECSFWNTKFDICEDIHEAKVICRKFCNLCKLVDGDWAEWSSWSECDVTCGLGLYTRTRTCTDPAPAYKGLDCEGSTTDTKSCVRPLCPVHGGWTDWSTWETCPVTCGAGIRKRNRKCTNPYPLRYGDHCFGESMDVKLCEENQCPGRDGGWTNWGDWSECSATCNGGLRERSRVCSNPTPDPQGKDCVGNPFQVEICNTNNCRNTAVAFNADWVTDCSPGIGQTMVFSNILLNAGGAYNNTTGVFVATRNGTYMFSAQLCIRYNHYMQFDIMSGNVSYATAYVYGYGNCGCPLAHAVLQLKENDNVYVEWSNWGYGSTVVCQDSIRKNYFSGAYVDQ